VACLAYPVMIETHEIGRFAVKSAGKDFPALQ
jgi:hypothetical protein